LHAQPIDFGRVSFAILSSKLIFLPKTGEHFGKKSPFFAEML